MCTGIQLDQQIRINSALFCGVVFLPIVVADIVHSSISEKLALPVERFLRGSGAAIA